MGCSNSNNIPATSDNPDNPANPVNPVNADKDYNPGNPAILQIKKSQKKKKKINIFLKEICKSICIIVTPRDECRGFLILLYKGEKSFLCLICNKHDILSELAKFNETIEVYYDNKNKKIKIDLNINERFIKGYKNIDLILIEILPDDHINEDFFLLPCLDYINETNDLKGENIYIPQFHRKEYKGYYYGKINKINDYEFTYIPKKNYDSLDKIYSDSYGLPIFLSDTTQVIGIYSKGNKQEIFGILIFLMIQLIQENIFLKTKKYGKNVYKGDFFNGKRDGNGKFIYENGDYYIGQWLKDKKHGLGKIYYNNGSIKYDGEFVNDKFQGIGKYVYEDGEYYIGQWSKGIRHGKGALYYINDKIKYQGNFVDDKYDGIGEFYDKNGEAYLGNWLKGQKNGKGIEYDKNGDLKYDGEFVNGKYEGEGKLVYEDGDYYIGKFYKGCKHGKGTEYHSYGVIKYKGVFVNNILKNKL